MKRAWFLFALSLALFAATPHVSASLWKPVSELTSGEFDLITSATKHAPPEEQLGNATHYRELDDKTIMVLFENGVIGGFRVEHADTFWNSDAKDKQESTLPHETEESANDLAGEKRGDAYRIFSKILDTSGQNNLTSDALKNADDAMSDYVEALKEQEWKDGGASTIAYYGNRYMHYITENGRVIPPETLLSAYDTYISSMYEDPNIDKPNDDEKRDAIKQMENIIVSLPETYEGKFALMGTTKEEIRRLDPSAETFFSNSSRVYW